MMTPTTSVEGRASNGIFFKVVGDGEPLLLLHGLMVNGAMFDSLVELLQGRFRMLVPDLRGHGRSGELAGPYDVPKLASDLDAVLEESGFGRCAVLGYSHGGAVAQQLAHTRPTGVSRMVLACTYANNVGTLRERLEATVFAVLLGFLSPGMLANLLVHPFRPGPAGAIGLTREQAVWLRSLMAANCRGPMRAAVQGMVTFDSRPWLKELQTPTLVIGGAQDTAVPQYHFDTLVNGIPRARGRLVERAGHTLIWTHTREFAEIVGAGLVGQP
jgi:3-oxoadipate enol-lactonase